MCPLTHIDIHGGPHTDYCTPWGRRFDIHLNRSPSTGDYISHRLIETDHKTDSSPSLSCAYIDPDCSTGSNADLGIGSLADHHFGHGFQAGCCQRDCGRMTW